MPINLQVVGKRLQDEELLGIAKVIAMRALLFVERT